MNIYLIKDIKNNSLFFNFLKNTNPLGALKSDGTNVL